jgi:hypothetical protein
MIITIPLPHTKDTGSLTASLAYELVRVVLEQPQLLVRHHHQREHHLALHRVTTRDTVRTVTVRVMGGGKVDEEMMMTTRPGTMVIVLMMMMMMMTMMTPEHSPHLHEQELRVGLDDAVGGRVVEGVEGVLQAHVEHPVRHVTAARSQANHLQHRVQHRRRHLRGGEG